MVEIIGFIISLLALLYLFFQNKNVAQQKRSQPRYQTEQDWNDPFSAFIKVMDKEAEARESVQRKPPPPHKKKEHTKKTPPRSPLEEHRLANSIEDRQLKSSLENRHIKSRVGHHENLPGHTLSLSMGLHGERNEGARASKIQSAIRRLTKRQDIIIYQEIMEKPKSLRSEDLLK